MRVWLTSRESRPSTSVTSRWFRNLHVTSTAQFIDLVKLHGACSLDLNLSGCIGEVLWVLVFFLIINVRMLLVGVFSMNCWHSLKLCHLNILLLVVGRNVAISIVTVPSLARCFRTSSCRTALMLSCWFLGRRWDLAFTCTSGNALLHRLLPLLRSVLQLLLFDLESILHNSADLIVLWALELLNDDLKLRCLNECWQLLEAVGTVPHILLTVDIWHTQLAEQELGRSVLLVGCLTCPIASIVKPQELTGHVDGWDSL